MFPRIDSYRPEPPCVSPQPLTPSGDFKGESPSLRRCALPRNRPSRRALSRCPATTSLHRLAPHGRCSMASSIGKFSAPPATTVSSAKKTNTRSSSAARSRRIASSRFPAFPRHKFGRRDACQVRARGSPGGLRSARGPHSHAHKESLRAISEHFDQRHRLERFGQAARSIFVSRGTAIS
jgi:hypothetical protein